jgi:hypothetical protein
MYVCLSRFPSSANPLQDNNADSVVQLQRQASQTKTSGVAKGVTGGIIGTGTIANKKQPRAFRFLA